MIYKFPVYFKAVEIMELSEVDKIFLLFIFQHAITTSIAENNKTQSKGKKYIKKIGVYINLTNIFTMG